MVSLSTEGLKALLLLNGGAVVALLAYLGRDPGARELAARVMYSCAFFLGGLVLAAISFIFAYLTQLAFYNEDQEAALFWGLGHSFWLTAALVSATESLLCFVGGAYSGIIALGWSK
jgi:hypothetical protein